MQERATEKEHGRDVAFQIDRQKQNKSTYFQKHCHAAAV
jgi:hypothetical protein